MRDRRDDVKRCRGGERQRGTGGGWKKPRPHWVERGKGVPKERELNRRREACEWERCVCERF